MNRKKLIEELINVAIELDARETSNNIIFFQELSYVELCEKGILILEKLKK